MNGSPLRLSHLIRSCLTGDAVPPAAFDRREGVVGRLPSASPERRGSVPLWLWCVAGGLIAWGIYYYVIVYRAMPEPTIFRTPGSAGRPGGYPVPDIFEANQRRQ